ncbi:MAG: aldose epimerase family protein [Bacteroidota bacterium]
MSEYTVKETNHKKKEQLRTIQVDFERGLSIEILNLGATITKIEIPDREGLKDNIVLCYSDSEKYLKDNAYLGCTVGRFANRIANGRFELNGKSYQLSQNHGIHHLHGGDQGFNKKIWEISSITKAETTVSILLSYTSKDGEEGYPGEVKAAVEFEVSCDELVIKYSGTSSKETIFNPTNHSYFNLSGDPTSNIDEHELFINARYILETDDSGIPTGRMQDVSATAYDFLAGKRVSDFRYDDCYVLQGDICLSHQVSGRSMKIQTSFPGMQLYTADYLADFGMMNRTGVCLETQFYPDSPNQPAFPSAILKPNTLFSGFTSFQFGSEIKIT